MNRCRLIYPWDEATGCGEWGSKMHEMSTAIERLQFAVRKLPDVLARFSEAESEHRPSPERWTKKEVIGHLIDSAFNNQQRFVRARLASEYVGPGYEQAAWVAVNGYRERPWGELVEIWVAANRHLAAVIERVPASNL